MGEHSFIPDGGLFQSDLWKEFQLHLGRELFKTPLFWGVVKTAPLLGRYGEASRGPALENVTSQALSGVFLKLAQEKNLTLLRVEPQYASVAKTLFETDFLVKKAPLNAQPKEILMLFLQEDEEAIFASMKPKTRYNIRLAQKKGVEVRPLLNKDEENQFLDMLAATAKRKNISFHDREYYRQFIHFFTEEKGTTFVAVKDGVVLAGSTVVLYEETAYYVHGGSSNEGRNVMAPHLLQWEQIRFAKSKGCTQYDFGGVAIQHEEKGKDWGGITRFKTGFAPQTKSTLFPGTYDVIFSPTRYYTYHWLARIKNFFV